MFSYISAYYSVKIFRTKTIREMDSYKKNIYVFWHSTCVYVTFVHVCEFHT